MAHPDVIARMRALTTTAAKAERERVKEETKKSAELENMNAIERATVEKLAAEERAKVAEKAADTARLGHELLESIADREVVLQDKNARDYLKYQAINKIGENPGMSMDAAVAAVLAESSWLVKSTSPAPAQETATPEQIAAAGTAPRPSTAPVARETTSPVDTPNSEGVDTLKMSPAEYQEYKRDKHSLH